MSSGAARPQIALVSGEVAPFGGGGIGAIVTAAATLLTPVADVTIVTDAAFREQHRALSAAGDRRLPPPAVRFVFADRPEIAELGAFPSPQHGWSARIWDALRAAFPGCGPDLVEFSDYLGEGIVPIQARRTADPWFDRTRVAVRLHTSSLMCEVLNGHVSDAFAAVALYEAERYCLTHADVLLSSGGDVLDTYRRFYADERLAPAECIPDAFLEPSAPDGGEVDGLRDGPLRLLYLGRLERRKGVLDLLRAVTLLEGVDWTLSLLGADTNTAPLRVSMRAQLELTAGGDPRVRFLDPVAREHVPGVIRDHHVVVSPSLWECWPNAVRDAFAGNRPVLATPVGGHLGLVEPGESGWLTDGTGPAPLARAIERIDADREALGRMIEEQRPRRVLRRLADPEALRAGYGRLLAAGPGPRSSVAPRSPPLVSIVVPYHGLAGFVEATMDSIAAQTYAQIETIVVNDGSFDAEDSVLLELPGRYGAQLVTQPNMGLGAARNTGIAVAAGRYVLPLDADDALRPTFVERCVAALEADPTLAYVTTWVAFMDDEGVLEDGFGLGYMPQGNWSRLVERQNVAGTPAAMIRKSVFDRGLDYSNELCSYEDWFLYREMRARGLLGDVIPEKLFVYRVRRDSMLRSIALPREQILTDEMRALMRRREMRWSTAV